DDNVFELLYITHPAQSIYSKLEDLVGWRWRPTDLSRCYLNVLVLDGVLDVHNRQSIGLELVRIQPDTHAVGSGAENRYLTNSRQTCDGPLQIDDRIVAQERFIEPIVLCIQTFNQQDIGADLFDVDSLGTDWLRQLWQRAVDGVLHQG